MVRHWSEPDTWLLAGTSSFCKLIAASPEKSVVVAKEAGQHYYGGQGRPQLYAPGSYRVLRVLEREDNRLIVEELVNFPLVGQTTVEPGDRSS